MTGDRPASLRELSMVCHELRRPLTVIRGAATLLLEAPDELPAASRAEMLVLIDKSVQGMSAMIEDLIVAAHLEAGALRLSLEPVPVEELMAVALEGARALHPGRAVVAAPPPGLVVEADREQAVRVLRTLLEDALEHSTEAGEVALSAVAEAELVRLLVAFPAPTGAAGPEDPREFDMPPPVMGPSTAAAGLGLGLAGKLARAMGGELSSTIRPGGGCGFSFTLNRRV